MNFTQIAVRMRDQMTAFLGNLSRHVSQKTARRFVREGLWGLCSRKTVHLSEIARSLNEDIALIKTENRLSRQAAREGLHEKLHDFVISQSAHRVGANTLLIIDPSDLIKPYGKAMEHLARVRDGSHGGYGDGYWLCQVVAVENGGREITPLVNHLWSQAAPGHRSENAEILTCVRSVTKHVASRGIWVMDRGGDRMSLMRVLLQENRRFLIRLMGNRHLVYRGRRRVAEELGQACPTPFAEMVTKIHKDGREERLSLEYGVVPVKLPEFPNKRLWMVVVKGFGERPIMMLTTEEVKRSRRSVKWAVEAYLTRWRIEETLRYAKQTFALEDVRVMSYQGLKNMMALALVAMSFTMTWLGLKMKLAVLASHSIAAAKRFFGSSGFHYYALSDGMSELLGSRRKRVFEPERTENTGITYRQLLLFPDG